METLPENEYYNNEAKPITDSLNNIHNRLNSSKIAENEETFFMDEIKASGMYSIIFHGLTIKFNLKPIESIVMTTIISLSKQKGFCYLGQRAFAKLLNVTIQTINATLQSLEKRKLIERGKNKSQFNTIKWKISPEVEYSLEYIRKRINNNKRL